jgi:class 3 adenylate cyclase/tetratricopeptide (TPR) repeat protein
MKCPRCEHENPPQAKFCLECGARVALACTKCRSELPAGAKFCLECGEPVASQATVEPRFTSPEAYTPKHLAEKILTSKAALEGERKQVTVLFADLKGSMELLADRDPEDARKLLDPVLERMMDAVHRYEGTVNQVMGDGIMALFGAPVAHEDHAVRACYAALRMQESVKGYSEEVRRTHGIEVQIRVGLNSGEVVVRSVGSDLHMDYTAVGQTTHLAARMEQLATPGSIRLTADTLRLVEGYVAVKSLGPVPIKGLGAPVEVYEATGAGAVRSRLQAAAARGLTRFVGRDAEVEQLYKALQQARAGHGQLVATVGEPGVGKSRLFYEFTHSHRTEGWLILESGSVSYGKATPYLPMIDLLKGYFKVNDRETHREIREKVTGKLLTLDRALEPTLPALMALLDVPLEDEQWQALDPPQRRQRTLDAVKRLLLCESQVQPLLVVFEDLHWIDSETQAVLESLVESLPTARLLLLVNYRPEYQHGWGSKTYYAQLRLDALPPESASELLLALLGTDATVEPLKPVLITRTGGNPLFIEESVRTLVETHVLTGERGAHRLARPLATIDVPATVQAILAARIDRLVPEDKQLLHTASVIGKDVPFALLLAIAGLAEEDLRRGLGRLQAAEFLYETRLFPDLEYTFKHALTHEVAYGGVLHQRRRALHAHIVGAIETLHADRLAEHAERLAHHAFRGGEGDKAVRYGREAAMKALGRWANLEATAYLQQALAALESVPESQRTREMAVDLRLDLYVTLLPLDQLRPLLEHLREAETLARSLEDRERLGWAQLHICHVGGLLAEDLRPMANLAHDVIAIAQGLGIQRMEADAYFWAGCWAYALGEHRRAVDLLLKGVDARTVRQPGQPVRIMGRSGYVAMFLAELGDFAEAQRAAEITMRDRATIAGHPWNLVNTSWQIAWVFALQGDLDRAKSLADRAIELCRQWGFSRSLGQVMSVLGHILVLSGRATEAVELLEQGLRRTDAVGHTWLRCPRVTDLGEAYLMLGRVQDAASCATDAVESARTRGERGFEAWALRLQAEIALAAQPPDVSIAEERYREAKALAGSLEMRPLMAHCHFGLVKLYRRTGKREQAREHLATATTMYREMDMRFWLEQAEAEMIAGVRMDL